MERHALLRGGGVRRISYLWMGGRTRLGLSICKWLCGCLARGHACQYACTDYACCLSQPTAAACWGGVIGLSGSRAHSAGLRIVSAFKERHGGPLFFCVLSVKD
jgi:hypothetical protein